MVPITVKNQDIYYVSLILLLLNCSLDSIPARYFNWDGAGMSLTQLGPANVLHDWPDAQALNILRSVRSAMASHSRLLIRWVFPLLIRLIRTEMSINSRRICPRGSESWQRERPWNQLGTHFVRLDVCSRTFLFRPQSPCYPTLGPEVCGHTIKTTRCWLCLTPENGQRKNFRPWRTLIFSRHYPNSTQILITAAELDLCWEVCLIWERHAC